MDKFLPGMFVAGTNLEGKRVCAIVLRQDGEKLDLYVADPEDKPGLRFEASLAKNWEPASGYFLAAYGFDPHATDCLIKCRDIKKKADLADKYLKALKMFARAYTSEFMSIFEGAATCNIVPVKDSVGKFTVAEFREAMALIPPEPEPPKPSHAFAVNDIVQWVGGGDLSLMLVTSVDGDIVRCCPCNGSPNVSIRPPQLRLVAKAAVLSNHAMRR